MHNITTIIYDFGGVIMDWNPRYAFKTIFNNDEKMEWFLENICTDDWNIEQDRGRSLQDGTKILQAQHPEFHDLIQAYYDNWETMLHSDIPESVEILKILASKYPIYGLTNWSAETFPIAYKRYPIFKIFKGILVSGAEKLIKPDPEIFKLMIERYQLIAENCLFIDDNFNNIEAARKLNFQAIHFKSAEQLKLDLINLGILDL